MEEHLLLCPNLKIPCINAVYGCPFNILRRNRGTHLKSCPASVIPCNIEWNRWPLCSQERKSQIPFAHINPQLKEEQLDVALAVRDQRMYDHWMKLPRTTRQIMRSPITPRHPPVPLVTTLWNPPCKKKLKSFSSEEGLINTSLESTPRQSAERSDASFVSTDDESPLGRRRKPPGLLQNICAQLLINKNQQQVSSSNPATEENDTLSDISNDFEGVSDLDSSFDVEDVVVSTDAKVPTPPSLLLLTTLSLDLSIECIPHYLNKPKSMYTFVCAQDFRRDEYAWHYRNWHSEIHGGLDGWMEQRCPLARYGCSYARRRLYPMGKGSRVVFSSTVESFGIKYPQSTHSRDGDNELSLSDLPFEVIRTIAAYLDSFSLCHFSLTCRLMRDVAGSLLPNRGMVIAQWEKVSNGWSHSSYRWRFSVAFNPIKKWGYEDGQHLSNHMKKCPFNIKSNCFPSQPVALPVFIQNN